MLMAPRSRTALPYRRLALLGCVLALGANACANRGMETPPDETGSGGASEGGSTGSGGQGGSASGGSTTSGSGGTGGAAGGRAGASGSPGSGGAAGVTGSGGVAGSSGVAGAGGLTGSGGRGGSGGLAGAGGLTGSGGVAGSGGLTGSGGVAGSGGVVGSGGMLASGGMTGTGGAAGAGGSAAGAGGSAAGAGGSAAGTSGSGGAAGKGGSSGGGAGGSAAGTTGSGGAAGKGGAGGAAGSGMYSCPLGGTLDCSTAGALKVPGGLVTDFSAPQWNGSQFCDADGLRGYPFAYSSATPSTAAAAVDTTAQNLKLTFTVGAAQGYAGGGLIFQSCVNAAAFTKVSFSATLTAGSMTGCNWQVQLQTQEQRPSNAPNPGGGTCNPDAGTTCYSYPAVTGLATPTATTTTYSEPFMTFTPTSTTTNTRNQLVGIQWQLNSANGTGTCTGVELRIDNITFQ
jgi:hypothetical protein